ncbi:MULTISPECIES: HAAS signaling domain-containing protein [Brevundimonas]|uniref:HAAS signaling domain-containing protein n=1 Tax=Brevundimonas TaxID=41275 RepID=UPI0013CEEF83|nr:hypothetical protein [Brevundimonas lutea]
MDLIDRYLKAVAAQLPAEERDDIVAELRDLILSRFEAREEALGRPLTEAEQLEILREVGHPLVVAARYAKGPDALVGPTLYPWWLFAVKAGLMLLAAVSAIGAVVQVVLGEVSVGRAIGHFFHDVFTGGITLIGLATVAGFILERQPRLPSFMDRWRVEDLALFEVTRFERDAWERAASASGKRAEAAARDFPSPAGAAMIAAAWTLIVFLWWTAALDIGGVTPRDLGAVVGGIDYRPIVVSMVEALFWPIFAYLLARMVFHLARVGARPGDPRHVRGVAAGEFVFAAARLAIFAWVWTGSALAPLIRFEGIDGLVIRLEGMARGEFWNIPGILTIIAIAATAEAAGSMVANAARMLVGRR